MIKLLYPCRAGGDTQAYKAGSHYGLDFGWRSGESDDILATASGTVTFEGYHTETINGNVYKPIMVIIKHDYSDNNFDYYSLYTHLAATTVDCGQRVNVGDKIGLKGNTGYSFGKHLHFQVMRMPKGKALCNWNANAFDPTPYLYRTENQIFHYQGNFNIPLEDNYTDTCTDTKSDLVKFKYDPDYEYKWSVDGNRYNTSYDITYMGGFGDDTLKNEGWEEVLAVNGSLFFDTVEGGHMAEGLEKSRGVNNQELEMTAVTDYNNAMSVACIGDELWYGSQLWIIQNKLNEAYGAITGLGLLINGKAVDMHAGFNSQWNQKSGRTVIGEDKDGNIMSYSFAGVTGQSGMTGSQLQAKCLELGFYNAICFDGGGSVWRRINGKNDITTTRKVKNALLLYRRKKGACEEPDDNPEIEELKAIIKEKEDLLEKANKLIESQSIELSQLNTERDVLIDKLEQINKLSQF